MISERIPLKRTKLLKSVVHFWLFTTNAFIITIKLFAISSIEPQKRVDEEIDNSEYILYLISSISRYGVIKRKIPAIYRPTNETKQTSPENEQGGIKKRISLADMLLKEYSLRFLHHIPVTSKKTTPSL